MAMELYNKVMQTDGLNKLLSEFIDEVEKGEYVNIQEFFINIQDEDFLSDLFIFPDCFDIDLFNGIKYFKLPSKETNGYSEVASEIVDGIWRRIPNNLFLNIVSNNRGKKKDYKNYKYLAKLLLRYSNLKSKFGTDEDLISSVNLCIKKLTFNKSHLICDTLDKVKDLNYNTWGGMEEKIYLQY